MATPKYLLEQALARFPILLIKDEARQERYLRDALEFYALHSGSLVRVKLDQPELLISPAPLSFNGCYNSRGEWVVVKYDNITEKVHVLDDIRYRPWDLSYFVNLRQWDLETPLPSTVEMTLIIDFIECLIGESNAQQMALTSFVANLDGMVRKEAGEYQQQRVAVEEAIRRQAHLPDFALL